MVAGIQREIRATDLTPERARDLLLKLSALMGNVLEEIKEADADYATVLLQHLDGEEAANRAKIRAETTEQFKRKQEARNCQTLMVEMSRAIKHYLNSLSEEMRLTR